MNHESFSARCYDLVRRVPSGYVVTYKDVAHALNSKAYRAVGNAMNKNPHAPQVPCHRVVCSDGSVGGFARGSRAKARLLAEEGVRVRSGKVLNFADHRFRLRRKK